MTTINQMTGLLNSGNRSLYFTFTVGTLDDDVFKVIDFTAEEGLSTPFTIKLSLASTRDDLTETELVDQNGLLTIYRNSVIERYFNAIVFSFRKGNTGRFHTFYEVIMVPALSRLSLRTNARIFQNLTVLEIAERLLGEMRISEYALSIRHPHKPREYCVQYSESDLNFIERICAEEGIFYYFEHEKNRHTIIFADDNSVADSLPAPCIYNNTEGGMAGSGCIRSLVKQAQLAPTDAVLQDYSFMQPSHSFLSQAGSNAGYERTYEHYMYPGRFKDDSIGQAFSKTRIDYLRRDTNTLEGFGDIARIISGHIINIAEHPAIMPDNKWLVTHVRHEGTQPQSLANEGHEGMTTYQNTFFALPFSQQWKPEPEIKPCIYGPQMATVVGPADEEIYVDEFGRVKVQFPWDREGKNDENSSCWVRVAQVGAGAGYGNIVIPRIGHEVIVSFLEGDPDQPLIIGSTFHATNRSSLNLPMEKTKMAFRGKTHDSRGTGEGYNEISFENNQDQQMVYIHAQKDMSTRVLNDRATDVTNNHLEFVGVDQSIRIGENQSVHVGENQTIHTGMDRSLTVMGDDTHKISGNQDIKVIGTQQIIVTGHEQTTYESDHGLQVHGNRSVTVMTGHEEKNIAQGSLIERISLLRWTEAQAIEMKATKTQTFDAHDEIQLEVSGSRVVITPDNITLSKGGSSITLTDAGVWIKGGVIHLNE